MWTIGLDFNRVHNTPDTLSSDAWTCSDFWLSVLKKTKRKKIKSKWSHCSATLPLFVKSLIHVKWNILHTSFGGIQSPLFGWGLEWTISISMQLYGRQIFYCYAYVDNIHVLVITMYSAHMIQCFRFLSWYILRGHAHKRSFQWKEEFSRTCEVGFLHKCLHLHRHKCHCTVH